MKKVMILAICIGLLCACSNTEVYKQIAGNWECTSWVNESKGMDKCKNNVRFEFKEDKTYHSRLGGAIDSGTFWMANELLYVTPKGKMEFGVKITKLNSDTLQFLMNQAGEEEILTLIKTER